MVAYQEMTIAGRAAEYGKAKSEFEACKAKGLKLDMSRGKPGGEQLALVGDLLEVLKSDDDFMDGGVDVRNYGMLEGIPSARALFAELLGVRPSEVLVAGNASLQLMYDLISKAYTHGLLHSPAPWCKLDEVKFLCPAPGYDRHFRVTQSFGFTLVTIPMTPDGPDMDAVEDAVRDPAVKGMWCVPKFSNPEGIIYSDDVIERIAALKPAAPDFALMWDNAYCLHEFVGPFRPFEDILSLCREAGNPDMVYEFASTSKITYPGAGVAAMACSEQNLAHLLKLLSVQTIGFDKINQLRHVRYLKDKQNTLALMQRHAAVLAPKFEAVLDVLEEEIAPLCIASWNRPEGGYFISLDTLPGCAARTLALCAEAGVVMTGAGAAFPYGVDPEDRTIRIAPSLPPVEELERAIEVFCICLRMASLERMGITE